MWFGGMEAELFADLSSLERLELKGNPLKTVEVGTFEVLDCENVVYNEDVHTNDFGFR